MKNTRERKYDDSFGERLLRVRKDSGDTQEEFSEKIGCSGRSATISDWESGKREPEFPILRKIAEVYEISLNWLLYGTGDKMVSYTLTDQSPAMISAQPPSEYGSVLNVTELTKKTVEVLESKTDYSSALARNIDAFHQAIQVEKELSWMKSRMESFEKQTIAKFDELAQLIKGLQEENKLLKSRRSSGEDPADQITDASSGTDRPSSGKTSSE